MPIIQIDWESIKGLFGDVTAIYAFTHRQASLLLSLSEQLTWEKTFRDWDYDFSDKDALDWEIADLQNNLMSPVDLTDLISYIDDIETILNAILAAQEEPGCCPDGVVYYEPPPVDDFDTVPQPIVDAGYASSTADVEAYFDYRCMAGHLFLNNVQYKLVKMQPYILGGFALFNLLLGLAGILTGAGSAVIIAGIAVDATAIVSLIAALKDLASPLPEDWADDLEACRDDIICAMLFADGTAAVKEAFLDAVEDCVGAGPRTVIQFLNLDHMLRALFYGQSTNGIDVAQAMADNGLDPADFDCCDYAPMDRADYEIASLTGGNLVYDSETDSWSMDAGHPGCWVAEFKVYTDGTLTTPKDIRLKVLSCTDAGTTCAGNKHHRMFSDPGLVLIYAKDHADGFPQPEDGVGNRVYANHNVSFSYTWRVYEP